MTDFKKEQKAPRLKTTPISNRLKKVFRNLVFFSAGKKIVQGKSPPVKSDTRGGSVEKQQSIWNIKGRKKFSSPYFMLLGCYLATVVLLLFILLPQWGVLPFFEIPGFPRAEKKAEYGLLEEKGKMEEEPKPPGAAIPGEEGKEAAVQATEAIPADNQQEAGGQILPSILEDDSPVTDDEEERLPAFVQEEITLPQAAFPLPQWELQSPFGSYLVERLPSGGYLHRFSPGAFLRAMPAAPVSALWDGEVISTGSGNLPYELAVLLEHEGGYRSFYGNLREIWVEKGSSITRGESLGLLWSVPQQERRASADDDFLPGEIIKLPVRTIWSGYGRENGDIGANTPGTGHFKADDSSFSPSVPAFYEDSPLLYLEVRRGNQYLDPLEFIPNRN